jgi:hypothetical protein
MYKKNMTLTTQSLIMAYLCCITWYILPMHKIRAYKLIIYASFEVLSVV